MQGGAWPECGDGPVGAGLVPGAACVVPDGALHEAVLEGDEVGDGLGLRREARDVVRLEAVDQLAHVVGLGLDGAQHGAVADRAVGAQEDEVVGEVGRREPKVRVRVGRPCVLQVRARGVGDGEPGLKGRVEAGGADEHVDGVLDARVGTRSAFGYLADFAVYDVHVGFPQCFEVSDPWGEAAASDVPVWDEAFFKVRVF